MTLPQIGINNSLDIPVWINVPATGNTNYTFNHEMIWQVHPMGEYIYYLAGDFSKDKKERLLAQQCLTHARVTVSFESDAISVAKADIERLITSGGIEEWVQSKKIAEFTKILPKNKEVNGGKAMCGVHPIFLTFSPWDGSITAHIDCYIIHITDEGERLTTITLASKNPKVSVNNLLKANEELVIAYRDIADLKLTGAERA